MFAFLLGITYSFSACLSALPFLSPPPQFGEIMTAFNARAEQQSTQLFEQAEHAQREYTQLLRFLGKSKEYAVRLASDEFFAEINKFLGSMKLSLVAKSNGRR